MLYLEVFLLSITVSIETLNVMLVEVGNHMECIGLVLNHQF